MGWHCDKVIPGSRRYYCEFVLTDVMMKKYIPIIAMAVWPIDQVLSQPTLTD